MNETPDTTQAAAEQAASAAEQAAGIAREPLGKTENIPAHTPDMTDDQARELMKHAANMPDAAGADPVTSTALHEIKAYADGTVAAGPFPLPDESPAGTSLDAMRAADVEQPVPAAEQVLRGFEVTGLGYVLNLQDIEAVARVVQAIEQDTPFDELDEAAASKLVAKIEDVLDGKLTLDSIPLAAMQVANAIKQACDTLIADYLRAPIELVTKHHTPVQTLGPRSIEEARALPMLGVLIEASSRPLDTDDGGIVAFKDHDGTTRRVFVLEDGTLAKA